MSSVRAFISRQKQKASNLVTTTQQPQVDEGTGWSKRNLKISSVAGNHNHDRGTSICVLRERRRRACTAGNHRSPQQAPIKKGPNLTISVELYPRSAGLPSPDTEDSPAQSALFLCFVVLFPSLSPPGCNLTENESVRINIATRRDTHTRTLTLCCIR